MYIYIYVYDNAIVCYENAIKKILCIMLYTQKKLQQLQETIEFKDIHKNTYQYVH